MLIERQRLKEDAASARRRRTRRGRTAEPLGSFLIFGAEATRSGREGAG